VRRAAAGRPALADDVFIRPNATFTNEPFPRSKHRREPVETRIGLGASLGANCAILPGVDVGRDAMTGAGSVVTRAVPARAIVMGSPARIVGYVDSEADGKPAPELSALGELPGGARLVRLARSWTCAGCCRWPTSKATCRSCRAARSS
jgi:UDP-2-acetamido-3-amino-2,3-dideoxy-glucuronate N-acetyltransferase